MSQDEIVMYIIVRKDLNMSIGKTAAQVGHVVGMVVNDYHTLLDVNSQEFIWGTTWFFGSYTKIVLAVNDLDMFKAVLVNLIDKKIGSRVVVDHGRTELEPDTITCMAITPMPKSLLKDIVGKLPLLK